MWEFCDTVLQVVPEEVRKGIVSSLDDDDGESDGLVICCLARTSWCL